MQSRTRHTPQASRTRATQQREGVPPAHDTETHQRAPDERQAQHALQERRLVLRSRDFIPSHKVESRVLFRRALILVAVVPDGQVHLLGGSAEIGRQSCQQNKARGLRVRQVECSAKDPETIDGGTREARFPPRYGGVTEALTVITVHLRHAPQQFFLGQPATTVSWGKRFPVGFHCKAHLGCSRSLDITL